MLDINSQEVIAAQVAGSFAESTNNSRTRTTIEIVSNPTFLINDIHGEFWKVPAHITTGDQVRAGDIIVGLIGTEVVGCFLR